MIDQPTDQAGVSIDEAARILGISREAVRLRIRRRTLAAERHEGVWAVHLDGRSVDSVQRPTRATDRPSVRPAPRRAAATDALVTALNERIAAQELELIARRREVEELHILLQRAGGRTLETPALAPTIQPLDQRGQAQKRPASALREAWRAVVKRIGESITGGG